MSSATTISSLARVSPQTLSSLLLSPSSSSKVAVIDVRDSDHVGGHIKGSNWVPMNQLDAKMPELLRQHADKDKVVFHCMLSQQRGPKGALKFARALEEKAEKETKDGDEDGEGRKKDPEVLVLEGGFGVWQSKFGEDERLTEGYVKDLWDE